VATQNTWELCRQAIADQLEALNLPDPEVPGGLLPVFRQVFRTDLGLTFPCLVVSLDAEPRPGAGRPAAFGLVNKVYPVTVTLHQKEPGLTDRYTAWYTGAVKDIEEAFRAQRLSVRGVWRVLTAPLDLGQDRAVWQSVGAGWLLLCEAREPVTGIPA
jgi:hypothetical protein